MSKEKFKEALEKAPEYKPLMKNMFGSAYLDHPDDSDRLPSDLQQVADNIDGQIFDISGLVNRAIEQAPKITCLENQTLLLKFLDGYSKLKTRCHPEFISGSILNRVQDDTMDNYIKTVILF